MIHNAKQRVCRVIYEAMDYFLKWPVESERGRLFKGGETSHGYTSYLFAVDGTGQHCLVHLDSKRSVLTEKRNFSIMYWLVTTFRLRIINLILGFPGSSHDTIVLEQAFYHLNRDSPFFIPRKPAGTGQFCIPLHSPSRSRL